MLETAFWIVGFVAGVFVLDRFLLWIESRGWIYYRRTKPGRGASTYHLLEWTSTFDPTQREVIEIRVKEERREDEAGDPLGPGRGDGEARRAVASAARVEETDPGDGRGET